MDELIQTQEPINLPLSSNHWRLWIISQQDKANPAYNLQLTYNIPTNIDYNVLIKSIKLLFQRHHTLFPVFRQKDSVPYIDITRRQVDIELVDFSDQNSEKRKEKILEFAGADPLKAIIDILKIKAAFKLDILLITFMRASVIKKLADNMDSTRVCGS